MFAVLNLLYPENSDKICKVFEIHGLKSCCIKLYRSRSLELLNLFALVQKVNRNTNFYHLVYSERELTVK